jgi:hypothetical protein
MPRPPRNNTPTPIPTEREVRDIVGASYDRDIGGTHERFNPDRILTLTAISGAYECASHVAFAIRGTPSRGLVILAVEYENPAVDCYSLRRLAMRQTLFLRAFLRAVCPTARVPVGWAWAGAMPATAASLAVPAPMAAPTTHA